MTQEEKDLLLKDLSARLPYGVITKNCKSNFDVPTYLLPDINGIKQLIAEYDLKPYLRPMSSMTKEEEEEFENLLEGIVDGIERWNKPDLCEEYDWLNKNGFDYRGLIPMGLALAAPEGMYKTV